MLTPDMEKDWMKSRGMKVHEWTEQEKKWLEERQEPDYPAACVRILKDKWDINQEDCECCGYHILQVCFCPLSPDYRDAAEYETITARILAQSPCIECPDKHGPNARFCIEKFTRKGAEACRLKHARIRAEREMDAE